MRGAWRLMAPEEQAAFLHERGVSLLLCCLTSLGRRRPATLLRARTSSNSLINLKTNPRTPALCALRTPR